MLPFSPLFCLREKGDNKMAVNKQDTLYDVKNRSASMVVYKIPEDGIRREFAPGESKKIKFGELEKLSYQAGGRALMTNFLQITNEKVTSNLNIHPHFKLYIYGEGYLKDQLASHINKLGLEKSVILAGTTQDIYDRIAESKALCMTSTYEGMSNVMMESICLGTPVITTKVSGVDELMENGKNGMIVSTNNPKVYADMVISYLNNPEPINSALANNDINKYRQEYIFNQWENLINKIVNNGKVW